MWSCYCDLEGMCSSSDYLVTWNSWVWYIQRMCADSFLQKCQSDLAISETSVNFWWGIGICNIAVLLHFCLVLSLFSFLSDLHNYRVFFSISNEAIIFPKLWLLFFLSLSGCRHLTLLPSVVLTVFMFWWFAVGMSITSNVWIGGSSLRQVYLETKIVKHLLLRFFLFVRWNILCVSTNPGFNYGKVYFSRNKWKDSAILRSYVSHWSIQYNRFTAQELRLTFWVCRSNQKERKKTNMRNYVGNFIV